MIPTTDRRYSELCLSLYLACRARAMALRYSIGRHILKSNHFDDIYCEVQSQERCLLYLFDLKHLHPYKSRKISFNELVDSSIGCDFDLRSYFKAFLQLRKQVDQPIQELAVWTKSDFNKKDVDSNEVLFGHIEEKNMNDLFESEEFGIRRFRIKPSITIEEELVKSNHPLYELADKVAQLMFRKSAISSKTVSKRFYLVLLKDVFKDETHFKEEFLRAGEDLCSEAKQFHVLLEEVLSEQFNRRKMVDFHQMVQIEQMPFAKLVKVKIADDKLNRRDINEATWEVDNDVSQVNVQEFLSLLVFYTNVPENSQFEVVLSRYCNKEAQDILEKICTKGVLLKSSHLDDIFELLSIKEEETRTFDRLQFKPDSCLDFEEMVLKCGSEKAPRKLVVQTDGDLQVSVNRVADVLKKSFKNFACLSREQFLDKRDKLSNLMKLFKTNKLDWWIVVQTDTYCATLDNASDLDCHIIIVATETTNLQNKDTAIYNDHFTFEDLLNSTKDRISSTEVLLQGRHFELGTLLDENALTTMSMSALSDWSQNCYQQIVIGEPIEAPESELFIPRKLKTDTGLNLDPFETDFESVAILCGLPGMGKSTLLKRLAVNFSKTFEDHIVLLVDFKKIVDWIDLFDMTTFILRLMDIRSADSVKKFLIHKLVQDNRVILLLDGFDEISLLKEENAIMMINFLKQANPYLLIIATRPHRLEILQKCLDGSTVYHLPSFTEGDQLQFLKQRLTSVSSDESLIIDLIQTFRSLFNNENPLEIPLQSEIIALIYEDELADQSFHQWNVAEVLQRFVDKNFEMFVDKFFDRFNRAHESILETLKISFEADHSELAFRLTTEQPVDYDRFSQLEQYGLLRIDDGKISFVHTTFAEYFVAQYLVRHQVDQARFNLHLLRTFCKPDLNRFDTFLEHHIRETDCRQKLAGTIASSQNVNLKELRSLSKYKLHPDKIKQFHIFLVECCSVEQQLEYIRRSIAKAELCIFQTVYESLPKSLVHEIRFKFASNGDDPFVVDLSKVGDDHLLQLLRILRQEHPKDVVEKIISNFNGDEDDFITVAIGRDHRELIVELFCLERSLSDEDESDLLQEYLTGRWQQYLKLIVEYQRDALLKHILQFLEQRFHQRVIKYFLMSCNIQRVLIEVFMCDQVDLEVVKPLLAFVEQQLSEYDLRVLMNRYVDGWGFAEKLKELRNSKVRELCESLWMRYGVRER